MIWKNALRRPMVAFLLLVLWLMLFVQQQSLFADQPNILWIVAEDMSPDLGCYGNQAVQTPVLDDLAKRGMRFSQVHTTGPACSPSRTSLATGVYQTTLGAFHMRYSDPLMPPLPEPVKILPDVMRECGYYTGNITKICGTGTGKDDWLFKTAKNRWDTKSWQQLINHQPFFGQINMSESHRGFGQINPKLKKEKINLPPYYPHHPVARHDWAGYLSEVMTIDTRVGKILEQLATDGLDKNTIVIFLSDHGRPMTRGKNWLYDSGTQIPLVIYYPPGVPKPAKFQVGSTNHELISAVDLVAETILMAGGSLPDWMQGRSFLREDSIPRTHLYTAVDRIGNIDSRSRAVRTDQYKYIRNFKLPGSIVESSTYYRRSTHPLYHLFRIMGERGALSPIQQQLLEPIVAEEVYDLAADPYETKNLAGDPNYAAIQTQLQANLTQWLESSQDQGLTEDSPAIKQHFIDYGAKNAKDLKQKIADTRAKVMSHFKD